MWPQKVGWKLILNWTHSFESQFNSSIVIIVNIFVNFGLIFFFWRLGMSGENGRWMNSRNSDTFDWISDKLNRNSDLSDVNRKRLRGWASAFLYLFLLAILLSQPTLGCGWPLLACQFQSTVYSICIFLKSRLYKIFGNAFLGTFISQRTSFEQ